MSLQTRLHCGLVLDDPYMVASSHWTAATNALKKIASVNPAAVTLKTTSIRHGSRAEDSLGKRNQRLLESADGRPFARFTDGPKAVEFWDLTTTGQYVDDSKQLMPKAKIGISILQGEDYHDIRTYLAKFHHEAYDYVELNLKYAVRHYSMGLGSATYYTDLETYFQELHKNVVSCLDVFQGIPLLVKFPREIVPFFGAPELAALLSVLFERSTSIVLANSLRTVVPRSFDKKSELLDSGVVTGDHLFMSTYHAICQLDEKYRGCGFVVASGGISSLPASLDAFVAGASAIQLCSALDDRGVNFVNLLRQQLHHCSGGQPLGQYIDGLCVDSEMATTEVAKSKAISKLSLAKITTAFQKADTALVPLFEDSIRVELAQAHLMEKTNRPNVPKTLAMVQSRGNLSGYAIQKLLIEEYEGIPLDVGTSGELLRSLRDPNFTYDLAIMPRSVFDELRRQQKDILGTRVPVELRVIGESQSALVGRKGCALENISSIYHFDGPTARSALLRLSREPSLSSPSIEVIEKSHLQALLAFWPMGSTILAKPPLSWMYGLLAPDDGSGWEECWQSNEDLLVVASQRFVESTDEGVVSGVVAAYIEATQRVAADPSTAAQSCLDLQLITYLRNLLDVASA